MSEFDSTVTLNVEIDDRSLANARDEIEDELGGVESAVAADAGTGGAGGGRQRRRRRLEFRWARENNENLAAILDVIDSAEFGGGGGGGIAGELLGAAGETAGDVAIETGDTVADALSDVLTGTVSTALGNTIAESISGSRVGLKRPPWVPLEVEDIDGGGRPMVDLSPTFEPVFEPTFQPTFNPELDLPDFNFGGGGGGAGGNLQTPHPVTIENTPLDVSLQDGVSLTINTDRRGGGGVAPPGGGGGLPGRGFGEQFRGLVRQIPGIGPALAGGSERVTRELQRRVPGVAPPNQTRSGEGVSPGARGDVSVSQGDVNVTVDADSDSLVRDVREEIEREFGRRLDQLERDLSDVEDQLNQAGGGTTGATLQR